MRLLAGIALAIAACAPRSSPPPPVEPRSAEVPTSPAAPHVPIPPPNTALATGGPRMVPPEAILRAYLTWFGGVTPREAFLRARGWNLFGDWSEPLAALGLPDYPLDVPRASQSNAMMLATLGRLGEALCVRAAERDLRRGRSGEGRLIFAFELAPSQTLDDFRPRFDVLHRTFLGYPENLAPATRAPRFYALFTRVAQNHAATRARLSADQLAWAAVCTALVMHPEAGVY